MRDPNVYFSDDYAGMVTELFAFYFGYEVTLCPVHGKDSQCECDERDWCFMASVNGTEVARFTRAELDAYVQRYSDPPVYLLAGIGRYLQVSSRWQPQENTA